MHGGKLITVERDLLDGNNGNMVSDELNRIGTINKNIINPFGTLR